MDGPGPGGNAHLHPVWARRESSTSAELPLAPFSAVGLTTFAVTN